MAEALNGDGLVGEGVGAPLFEGGGLHAEVDAEAGHDGGLAAAAIFDGETDDVVGLLGDVDHVLGGCADVLSDDELAAEGFDGASEAAEEGFGLVGAGVGDDEGLAAAEVESGEGGLVGHGLGESEDVFDGGFFGLRGARCGRHRRRGRGWCRGWL